MDITSLRLFLCIAELGGISTAAQDLSLSPASASARLNKLEEQLGARLFNRTTRAVSLTTHGEDFLPHVREALDALDTGADALVGRLQDPHGLLRMTMPGSFGRMYVVPLLAEFRRRYPRVDLDLRLSDEVLDVVGGAFDLIIRNAPLKDSNFVARRLAKDRRVLVAAPDYLERRGRPLQIDDLRQHDCIGFQHRSTWEFQTGETIGIECPVVMNEGEAMRQFIEAGGGIGIKSLWNAAHSLRSGALVEVLPDKPLVTRSAIWMVYPSHRMVPQKVRAMVAFLEEAFSPSTPWDPRGTDSPMESPSSTSSVNPDPQSD